MIFAVLCLMPITAFAAKTVTLTLHSVPEGAAIIQNGVVIGVTPTFVQYNSAAYAVLKSGQCFTAEAVTARWTSGATSTLNTQLCPANGYNQQYTFLRPAGVDGAIADAQVAAANQSARTAQYLSNEQAADNNAAMISNAINNAATNYNQSLLQRRATYPTYTPPPITAPVTCTTSTFFGQLKTVCQ